MLYTFSAQIHCILLIMVTETVVKANVKRQGRWKSKFEVIGIKPSPFQHILLQQKHLLLLISYLWHYNRYFTLTHSKSTHPTLNCREDV